MQDKLPGGDGRAKCLLARCLVSGETSRSEALTHSRPGRNGGEGEHQQPKKFAAAKKLAGEKLPLKKPATWLMTERGAAHFLQKNQRQPPRSVCTELMCWNAAFVRLTETSRARQFAKPAESIKLDRIWYNLTCGYLSLWARMQQSCRRRNERRRATFFLASGDRLNFMLCIPGNVDGPANIAKVGQSLGAFHYANSRDAEGCFYMFWVGSTKCSEQRTKLAGGRVWVAL